MEIGWGRGMLRGMWVGESVFGEGVWGFFICVKRYYDELERKRKEKVCVLDGSSRGSGRISVGV